MKNKTFAQSELVLTPSGRVYHLNLEPGDIGQTVFLFGDPDRVKMFSSLFDTIELRMENREFVTHTGTFNKKRISAVSTGIGTDNIDIVLNELDAVTNINLQNRSVNPEIKSLELIRVGTSGALHEEIDPGSLIVTKIAGGLDNLIYYYDGYENIIIPDLTADFSRLIGWPKSNSTPYFVHASGALLAKVSSPDMDAYEGITLSAPGFYGPQGRSLRIRTFDSEFVEKVSAYQYNNLRVSNFEMEASALYGLSKMLGHEAVTVCMALANRKTNVFLTDYKKRMLVILKSLLENVTN